MPEEAFSLLPGTFWVPFVPKLPVVGTLRGDFVPEDAFFLLLGTFRVPFVPKLLVVGTFWRVFVTNACK